MKNTLKCKGRFDIEYHEAILDASGRAVGHKKPRRLAAINAATVDGRTKLLDVMFDAATQIPNWYFGLVNNAAFTGFDPADIMSSHVGWTENADYDEATRVEWAPSAAAAGEITGAQRTFTMNVTAEIYGLFVASIATKSTTTGTLWSTAPFSEVLAATPGSLIRVIYTVVATAS